MVWSVPKSRQIWCHMFDGSALQICCSSYLQQCCWHSFDSFVYLFVIKLQHLELHRWQWHFLQITCLYYIQILQLTCPNIQLSIDLCPSVQSLIPHGSHEVSVTLDSSQVDSANSLLHDMCTSQENLHIKQKLAHQKSAYIKNCWHNLSLQIKTVPRHLIFKLSID